MSCELIGSEPLFLGIADAGFSLAGDSINDRDKRVPGRVASLISLLDKDSCHGNDEILFKYPARSASPL